MGRWGGPVAYNKGYGECLLIDHCLMGAVSDPGKVCGQKTCVQVLGLAHSSFVPQQVS